MTFVCIRGLGTSLLDDVPIGYKGCFLKEDFQISNNEGFKLMEQEDIAIVVTRGRVDMDRSCAP